MAKIQTNVTTGTIDVTAPAVDTTDLFLNDTVNNGGGYIAPTSTLSTGEKVAIGFGIAGGAVILAWCIYKGIKYIITKTKEKDAPQMQVAPTGVNLTGVPQIAAPQYMATDPNIINAMNNLSSIQQGLNEQQTQIVNVMGEMSKAIKNRSTDEYNNLVAQVQQLQQQLEAVNKQKEYVEGQYNVLYGQNQALTQQINSLQGLVNPYTTNPALNPTG